MSNTRRWRLPVGIVSAAAVTVVALTALPPTDASKWLAIALGAALVATDVVRYCQGDRAVWQRR